MVAPWSWTLPGGVNMWVCDQCSKTFNIIDEQPTISRIKAHLDITTFGDSKKSYLAQEIIERRCSSCA